MPPLEITYRPGLELEYCASDEPPPVVECFYVFEDEACYVFEDGTKYQFEDQ